MQQIYNLFDGFSDESRVWLYTANRAITPTEAHFVQENLELSKNEDICLFLSGNKFYFCFICFIF